MTPELITAAGLVPKKAVHHAADEGMSLLVEDRGDCLTGGGVREIVWKLYQGMNTLFT